MHLKYSEYILLFMLLLFCISFERKLLYSNIFFLLIIVLSLWHILELFTEIVKSFFFPYKIFLGVAFKLFELLLRFCIPVNA
jgi:hypothetical protein